MPKFNGHKNWNHWNVSLWINNDEGLYRMAMEYAKRYTLNVAAECILDELQGQKTPDGAPYTYSSIRAAISGMR